MTGSRPTTSQRGYGRAHQRLRKRWAPRVATGLVTCWRCGEPIEPGDDWDLGHDDRDRTVTKGPEHQRCNRSTSSRRPSRKRPTDAHPGLDPEPEPGQNGQSSSASI